MNIRRLNLQKRFEASYILGNHLAILRYFVFQAEADFPLSPRLQGLVRIKGSFLTQQ